jgi:hypothetical protein
MKKVFGFLRKNPEIIFFICAFILWTAFMCNENSKEGGDFSWHDLKVEANGMIFDLFVFGILLSIYEALREKKEKIERLHEEIDDYREWPEKEAKFRLMGSVRRLIREGENKLNLRNCYLEETRFADWNLSNTHFDMANLLQAKFYQTVLIGSTFQEANLKNAAFYNVDLTGANFSGADLEGVDFSNVNLSNVTLEGAIVWPLSIHIIEDIGQKAYPFGSDDWFRKLETDGVIGWQEIENKYYVDQYGILRLK